VTRAPEVDATIDSLAESGEGVAHVEGKRVLVAATAPGDRVRLRLDDAHHGTCSSIEVPSPERVAPHCPVVEECGGCAWQHVSSAAQQEARVEIVRRALPKELRALPIASHPAPVAYGYRTRARLAWATVRGGTRLGYRPRRSNRVLDIPGCPILAPALEAALPLLRTAVAALPPSGEVGLTVGRDGKPVVSLHPEKVPDARGFEVVEQLVREGLAGAALWAPGASKPATAGDPKPVTRGGDGAPLTLAVDGFAQANESLNLGLARYLATQARCEDKNVLELFAGAGNFTVLLARMARAVAAVESDREAVASMLSNLAARELENVTVLREDAAEVAASRRADVVVLDPPRTGAKEVCTALVARPARRVVYVSCDPASLGRDLAILGQAYELVGLAAFEMFPHTPHVETVATCVQRRTA
jgi:23S rRNA (uracil1939-C5)-methyltransferase